MYSVVLLTALAAGGEAGALGHGPCNGGWWYAPIPYVDTVWPAGIHYAPSPARFAAGGQIGPSLQTALGWITSGDKPLGDAERKAWADYYKELTPEEQAEIGPVWRSADTAGRRKLLEQVAAIRGKEKDKDKD